MWHGWATIGLLGFALTVRAQNAPPPAWPTSAAGLVFSFQTHDIRHDIQAWDSAGNSITAFHLAERDRAHYDHNYAMVLDGGSCTADDASPYVVAQCRKSGALTIEAHIEPRLLKLSDPGVILGLSVNDGPADFALMQNGDKLCLALKPAGRGTKQEPKEPMHLLTLTDTKPFQLTVTCSPGSIDCYRDGNAISHIATLLNIDGNFSNWTDAHLVFGADWTRAHNWPGLLEGVALFSRALDAKEVAADAAAYSAIVAPRKPPPILKLRGLLLAKSSPGDIDQLGTYTRAVVTYEYQVKQVISGHYTEKKIRVAHWAVFDRKPVKAMIDRPIGQEYDLTVEPFDGNPQMQSELQRDELPVSDLPLFYDVTP